MELPERDDVVQWVGRPVLDEQGEAVGSCRHVYADEATGVPEWLVVELDGGRGAFVPLTDARSEGGDVHVAFSRSAIAGSPDMGDSGHLEPEQDVRLYEHYGLPYSKDASPTVLPTAGPHDSAPADTAALGTAAPAPVADTAPPLVPIDVPDTVAPEPAPPVVLTPTPAPAPAPAPRPTSSSSSGLDVEPLVLGGLALAAAVLAVLRVLRGRHKETPREKAVRQARERAGQLAQTSASTRKDLTAAGLQLARAAVAKRDELAEASGPARKEFARNAASTGRDLAAAAAARREELARTSAVLAEKGAAKRDDLAKAGAAKRKDLAKAGAAKRKDLAAAGAARREELAKAAAARRKELAGRRKGLAKATASRRKGLRKGAKGTAKGVSGLTDALTGTASRGVQEARELGGTVLSVPSNFASDVATSTSRRTRKVKRSARRTSRRLQFGIGAAAGYVVGARAGRERYQEIVQQVSTLVGRARG